MEHDRVMEAEALIRKDGYIEQANIILELEKELKIVTRAYEELYRERYGDTPRVYGHV